MKTPLSIIGLIVLTSSAAYGGKDEAFALVRDRLGNPQYISFAQVTTQSTFMNGQNIGTSTCGFLSTNPEDAEGPITHPKPFIVLDAPGLFPKPRVIFEGDAMGGVAENFAKICNR